MLPTLDDGDLLLVDRGAPVGVDALVVVRLPGIPLAVKRVRHWHADPQRPGWWVERDNPREGTDSWTVGSVDPADVVAVVLGRLWPRPRVLHTGRFTSR
jgi:hypothetical protein